MTPVIPDARRSSSLGALLDDALVTHKSEVAFVEATRNRESARLTYLDAKRLVGRVTQRLADLGVGAGDRVAILAGNQPKWAISAMAVFRRGGILVPLDYKLTPEEQVALLRHARPKVLIADFPIARLLKDHDVPTVLVLEAPDGQALPDGQLRWEDLPEGPGPEPIPRTRDDVATIVYSSGTGGRPKGCMLPHRAYLHQLAGLLARHPMAPGEVFFSILPTNHAIDFLAGFVGPLVCGATVLHQRVLRPEFLLSTMQRYSPTHMAVVPAILTAFERAIREKTDALDGWRSVAFGAARGLNRWWTRARPDPDVSRRLLRPIHDAFGGRLQVMFCGGAYTDRERAEFFYQLGIPVLIGYGTTESCTVATLCGLDPYRADSVGSVVDGVQVKIHAPDADGVGEVWIGGPTLMVGYLDDPELTAETLTPDGWLRTGDLGWMDASYHLRLVGRSKDVIVTEGGKNVYPEDLEAAFSRVACEELAVFAEDYLWPRRGLEHERLVVVVRPKAGEDPASALREANLKLADYKRVSGILRWDAAFPRTATMKVKRGDLAGRIRAAASRDQVEAL